MSSWGASRRWLWGAAVAVALAAGVMPPAAPAQAQESGFSDVPVSHPFHDEIMWLASSGITTGYPDGTFRPGASISREAMAAFFYRFAGEPAGAEDPGFSDVPTSHTFYEEIAWLASSGITTGYPDGTFQGGARISREAMAAFFYRYAGAPASPGDGWGSSVFSDVSGSHPFFDEIAWMASSRITTGYGDCTFRPGARISRQAMAAFFHRMATAPTGATTERVSVASDGTEGNDSAGSGVSVSADGRFVAFVSRASNLVPGTTNDTLDVFVHDRDTGATERVSVASDGTESDGSSSRPSISGDGRYVAFVSSASSLVPDVDPNHSDVFVHDRADGTTELVSEAAGGGSGNRAAQRPAISADGRFVAFDSGASDLVIGDTNGAQDIFVRDLEAGTTERVSVGAGGAEATASSWEPAISANGGQVAFTGPSPDLVENDTNGEWDVFVHDRAAGVTERVSVASDGTQANHVQTFGVSISADGRHVAFAGLSSNLVPGDSNDAYDVFVRDRVEGTTERVSLATSGCEGSSSSIAPSISADGRYVVFASEASNLVPGDTNEGGGVFGSPGGGDVFVRDRVAGTTERASVAADGTQASLGTFPVSNAPAISADGRFVVFGSGASNLVPDDTNDAWDVFVRDRGSSE